MIHSKRPRKDAVTQANVSCTIDCEYSTASSLGFFVFGVKKAITANQWGFSCY